MTTGTTETMTYERAQAFARRWAEEWNRRDVEAVLAHFADNVSFTSPKAAATVGTATVEGKAALRAYWLAGLQRLERIRFEIDHAIWDPAGSELAIVYAATLNGQTNRAIELLHLNSLGLADRGEALYGALL
ncbi:MAG TPA: nuclear transport factor 2 family protein [Dehalococcoidia bacterium]|nr:nuclear transport factor 2 family protein [Dehalococcoidia bacterium]